MCRTRLQSGRDVRDPIHVVKESILIENYKNIEIQTPEPIIDPKVESMMNVDETLIKEIKTIKKPLPNLETVIDSIKHNKVT